MKKQDDKKNMVKTEQLLTLLKQVSLGGLLEECVLSIEEGVARIEAVDITNSLIVICKKKILNKEVNIDLGLGNIDILIKFLSTLDANDKLILKHPMNIKGGPTSFTLLKTTGRRKLTYLLTNTELIASQIQYGSEKKEDPYKKIKDMVECKIELTKSFMKDFLSYINLLKIKDVTLDFDGEEEVSFICGGENDHQFTLTLSTDAESDFDDSFEIKINGEFLSKIFSIINFDDDDPPIMSFAEDKIVIVEDAGATWAIVPLTNQDED